MGGGLQLSLKLLAAPSPTLQVPPPSLAGLLDSGSKRKRAVTAAV